MPHRVLANLLAWQLSRSALPRGAKTLQLTSLSFDVSFQEIFATLNAGGTLVLVSEEDRRDADALWRIVERESIVRLFMPYVSLQQLAEAAATRRSLPTSLREVITAGEQLMVTPAIRQLFERIDARLYNQYGPTESHVVTELVLEGAPKQWSTRPTIGRAIPNAIVHILDEHGEPAPIGVPGELFIAGEVLARGYLHRPELTAERFVPSPSSAGRSGARMYRTGDRARYLSDGNIEFLGRVDEQLKIRGYRVEPGEIEAELSRHGAVRAAAIVARLDGGQSAQLIGYVELQPGIQATAADMRSFLMARLPEHMVPSAFVILDALPLTPSGKIDRRALPDAGLAAMPSQAEHVPPRTPVEETLANIWKELLRIDKVGIRDNFFDLGGHSLLATRVVARIRHEMHVEVPLRRLFEAPTIELLAVAIVEASIETAEGDASQWLAEIEALTDEELRSAAGGGAKLTERHVG